MSEREINQPGSKPPMSTKPSEKDSLAKDVSKEFLKGAAKEGGDQTVQYEVENNPEQVEDAQQQLDDAQAQAQGMWAKYCGCLSSAA